MRGALRPRMLASSVSAILLLASLTAYAQITFDLPAQPLGRSLVTVANLANVNLLYDPDVIDGLQAPALKATLSADEALARLLEGTGLSVIHADGNTVRVINRQPHARPAGIGATYAPPPIHFADGSDATSAAALSATDTNGGGPANKQYARGELEEVLVTAQKRTERLIDVPVAVSAISGARLESLQVKSLTDLANFIPGLAVSNYGAPGLQDIVIRGLSTGVNQAGPLVSTYVDDVAIGSSTSGARGSVYGLDLNPYDIDSVQVLKGPQGTLYGANSLSGLIKYSLIKPNVTQFDGRLGLDTQHVNASGGEDWSVRGAVNLPIVTGVLAARISGFYQDSAGYIDNIGIGKKDSNHSTESGGRATVLWSPMEQLSVQANALIQNVNARDVSFVVLDGTSLRPLYGSQTTSSFFPMPFKDQVTVYSLEESLKLNFATLTAISSWSRVNAANNVDYTVPYAALYVPAPDALSLYEVRTHLSKFTQELRLGSPENLKVQWRVGGYFTHESAVEDDNWPSYTSTYVLLPFEDNLYVSSTEIKYKEAAGFGDLTYKLNSRFDLSGGVRYSSYQQNMDANSVGIFGVGDAVTHAPYISVWTWMADARFHVDPDKMVYARFATGYRPGTINPPAISTPLQADPDKTMNYEIGFKGRFLDGRLELDAAAFYCDWRDIQLYVNGLIGYQGNGGSATSRGFEISPVYELIKGLRLNATLSYTDAFLNQDSPDVGGLKGDQLPYSARWNGSLAADYTRPLQDGVSLTFGGSYRYRGTVYGLFPSSTTPEPVPPQKVLDLYGGVNLSKVTIRAYIRNVSNNRSYDGMGFLADPTRPRFTPIQPRTIGISTDFRF